MWLKDTSADHECTDRGLNPTRPFKETLQLRQSEHFQSDSLDFFYTSRRSLYLTKVTRVYQWPLGFQNNLLQPDCLASSSRKVTSL